MHMQDGVHASTAKCLSGRAAAGRMSQLLPCCAFSAPPGARVFHMYEDSHRAGNATETPAAMLTAVNAVYLPGRSGSR